MKGKDRVIVIDLFGESEETVVEAGRAGKDGEHECRCGVCNCGGKGEPEHSELQLELQLQSYELPTQWAGRPVRGALPVPAPGPMSAGRKYLKH